MFKTIIKEILIIILLIIAILLILGIVLYDYNPINKKVPTVQYEAYTLTMDKAEEELQETLEAAQTQNIVQTYTVTMDDLTIHQRARDYVAGRINPFDEIYSTDSGTGSQTSSNTNSNTNTNTTNSNPTGGNNGTQNSKSTNETPSNPTQGRFLNEVK